MNINREKETIVTYLNIPFQNTLGEIKETTMDCTFRMGHTRNAYNILVEKLLGKLPPGSP
jgi:hypothetical protein